MKRTAALAFVIATSLGITDGKPTAIDPASAQHPVTQPAPLVPEIQEQTDVSRALGRIETAFRFEADRAADQPGWTSHRNIAQLHLGKARLVGTAADYAAADEAMADAFDVAAEGSGPFLERAVLNMTMHRVGEVEADLNRFEQRILIQSDDRARVLGLRGDVAMQTGDLDAALQHYQEAEALDPTMSSAARIANFKLKTGRYDEARTWYERARQRTLPDTLQRAWALLHLGIVELEANNVSDTMQWYTQAEQTFTGWYLIEEHIAESLLLQGDIDGAIDIYLDVLQRVPNGEFYAALADAYDARGDHELARQAREDAARAFERDIAVAPTAVSGHAIDFFLGTDPARALQLARQNFERRPGPQARTKLAQAFLAVGDPGKAARVLQPIEHTQWATVDYLATAALAFAQGRPVLAGAFESRAVRVNPTAVSDLATTLNL